MCNFIFFTLESQINPKTGCVNQHIFRGEWNLVFCGKWRAESQCVWQVIYCFVHSVKTLLCENSNRATAEKCFCQNARNKRKTGLGKKEKRETIPRLAFIMKQLI